MTLPVTSSTSGPIYFVRSFPIAVQNLTASLWVLKETLIQIITSGENLKALMASCRNGTLLPLQLLHLLTPGHPK